MIDNSITKLKDADESKNFELSGKTINLINSILRSLWAGANVGSSATVLKESHGPSGYNLKAAVGGTSVSGSSPFGITWRANPDDPSGDTFQAMVNTESDVLQSVKPDDSLSITGLGAWFNFLSTDVIALYLVISAGRVTSGTIQSYGQGNTTFDPTSDPWNDSDNGIVFDDGGTPASQIGANILLGYSNPDAKGNPYLVQCQLDHVLLENGVIQGRAAVYDFSHRRRYGITAPV